MDTPLIEFKKVSKRFGDRASIVGLMATVGVSVLPVPAFLSA